MIINAKLPIAADKREIKDFFKLPSATSFIRKMVGKRCLELTGGKYHG